MVDVIDFTNKPEDVVNVDPNTIENMKCSCGNGIFIKLFQLKHVSAFYTRTGSDQGLEYSMNVCTNPHCGRMYGGAMNQADIKRSENDPNVARYNWVEFFAAGVMAMEAVAANLKGEKDGNKDLGRG